MAYLLTALAAAALNATPLPVPPTWLVLVLIAVEFELEPLGVALAGALGAAVGRVVLVLAARALGERLLRPGSRENVAYLARRLEGRSRWGVGVVLAVSPPPAGAIYAAAGLLRVPLGLVAAACLGGRLAFYSASVWLGAVAASEASDRIRDSLGPVPAALGTIAIVGILWLLVRIDWRELLERRRLRIRRAGL